MFFNWPIFLPSLFVIALSSGAQDTHSEGLRVQYKINKSGEKLVIGASTAATPDAKSPRKLRSLPYYIAHDEKDLDYEFEEWEYPSKAKLPQEIHSFLKKQSLSLQTSTPTAAFSNSEMRIIREQGPSANRINLTIIGDGYTLQEKDKFFEDVEWITKGLFETSTFGSYLPLFNVYAVYVPSQESGIGDGSPKNTAFRLYRNPRGSKRGIMPGNEAAMERAVAMAPATDYPIVVANDDYYGGLGGRWAISTRSRISGLKVLRHELGHNFGEVGEEYDNGYVYRGANASYSTNVPWTHWQEDPNHTDVHEAKLLSGDYIWQDLGRRSYEKRLSLPRDAYYLDFDLSSVGWSTRDDVHVKLNDQLIDLDGEYHRDRGFFHFTKTNINPRDSYTLSVRENIQDGDNVLGFALAYAMPSTYDFSPNKVGAFASYNAYGRKSYRPTHKSCLMKDMEVENFCVVDQENMWIKFLERVSLIDSLTKSETEVILSTQDIEDLDIRWYRRLGSDWIEEGSLRGVREWTITDFENFKDYKVSVELTSEEVRKDHPSLIDEVEFSTP